MYTVRDRQLFCVNSGPDQTLQFSIVKVIIFSKIFDFNDLPWQHPLSYEKPFDNNSS